MPKQRWAFCLIFLFFSLVHATKHFEATLHFEEFNHQTLAKSDHDTQKCIEIHEEILRKRLQNVFDDPKIEAEIFDVIESGEEVGKPTISVRALISSQVLQSREQLIQVFESKLSTIQGLYLFAVKENPEKHVEKSGLHNFHKKYAKRAAGQCLNRGFLLPNNTCVCQNYYSGSDCSVQNCMNSGIVSQNFRCSCPPGFVGRHCEQLSCMAGYDTEFDFSKKSFVLVLNTRNGSAFFLGKVAQVLTDVLPSRAALFKNFILSTYYQDTSISFSYTTISTNYKDFLTALNSQISIHAGVDAQPTLSAINRALVTRQEIVPRSDVYVFTNSLPSDFSADDVYAESSTTAESVLTRTVVNWGHSVYVVLAQNPVAYYNDSDSSLSSFSNIAAVSNGEFIYVGNSTSNGANAFRTIFRFNYLPETIAVRRNFDCSTAASVTVNLGPYDSGFFLYTTGTGITVSNGQTQLVANGTFGNFQVFSLDLGVSSAVLSISGSTSCSYRFFTSSAESVVLGFSRNADLVDVSASYPSAFMPYSPVARVVSLGSQISVQMAAVAINDPTKTQYSSASTPDPNSVRADCNFPLNFNPWNSCTPGAFLAVLQYQDNTTGNPIVTQRVRPSVCFKPIPRDPVTIPLNCNGGTMLPNNTCACLPYHSGPTCATIICQNGGSVNVFPGNGRPLCYCAEGFTGEYCDQMVCTTSSAKPDTSRKAINIILEATISASYYKAQVKAAANAIATDPDASVFYDAFVLTTFANSSADPVYKRQNFSDVASFLTAIDGAPSAFNADGQLQNALTALHVSLYAQLPHKLQQVVFLIVDSLPGDASLADTIVGQAINIGTAINVIVVKPYGNEGDDTVTCIEDLSVYQKLTDGTGGLIFNLCHNVDSVQSLMTGYGKILYNFQVASRQMIDCSSTATVSIEANDGIQTRYVILVSNTGNNFNFQFADPIGQNVSAVSTVSFPGIYINTASFLVQRGNYSVSVSPAGNVPGGLQCLLLVAEPAGQTVLVGFASNPSIDYSTLAAQYGSPQHPVIFMSTQLQSAPTVTISITVGNQTYTAMANPRDTSTCQFDYYVNSVFSCSTPGQPITINVRFTTSDGVSFTRAIASACEPPVFGTCLNGGYYLPNDETSEAPLICTCPVGYEGTYCDVIICWNGGVVVQDQCQCPPNYVGAHCEILQCKSWDFMASFDTNVFAYETIAFIVNTNLVSVLGNKYLATGITDFVNNVHAKDHPKQFILVTFDDVKVDKIISTTDPIDFISTFQAAVVKPSGSNNLTTQVLTLDAILETIKLVTYKPAIFFAFSSTMPKTPKSFMTLNALLGQGGIQVNHIVTGLTTLTGASNGFYLYQTAIPTGGRLVALDVEQTPNLISNYLAGTVFENVVIEDKTFSNCYTKQWIFVPVENRAKWITVIVRGKNVNNPKYVDIYDAAGLVIDQPSNYLTVNSSGTVVYVFPATAVPNFSGYWKLSAETSDPSPCQIQVRTSTPLQTMIGFTMDEADDFPHKSTFNGGNVTSRYVTVGVSNDFYLGREAFLEYVKISLFDDVETGSNGLVVATPLKPRTGDSCSYQYVTPYSNIPKNGATGIQSFRTQINGQDEKGQNFQQILWFMPQTAKCANGATTDATGFCVCDQNHTGDDCSVPICQNGGTSDMAVCNCLSGFYGDFCQNRVLSNSTTSVAPPTTPQLTTLVPSTSPTTPPSTSSLSPSTALSSSSLSPPTTAGATGVPPPITTDTTACDYTGQNFKFAFFVDTTIATATAQSGNFISLFNNFANVPNPAGASRTVVIYSTATGNLQVSAPIQMNDAQTMENDYNSYVGASTTSTVSLMDALNHYNASGDRPDATTSAPTIIMLNDASVTDAAQIKPILDSFRNPANRVAFVISLTFNNAADQALSGLTFDYSKDLTNLTVTGIPDTAKEIVNFVCLNNHRS